MPRLLLPFLLTLPLWLQAQSPVPIPAAISHGAVAACADTKGVELVAVTEEGERFLLVATPDCRIGRFRVEVRQSAAVKNAPTYHVVGSDRYNGIKGELRPIEGCDATHSNEPGKCRYLVSEPHEQITIFRHK